MRLSAYRLFSGLPKRSLQKGLSLIELIICMALGFLMMVVLLKVMYMASFSSTASTDFYRMQESGDSALDFMGYAIRQAGARSDTNYNLYGLNYDDTVNGVNGNSGAPDTLTVKYEFGSGTEVSCGGATVTVGTMLTYTFSVDPIAQQLLCNDGLTTVVIAENIEDMQIQYGIDDLKDGSIDFPYTDSPTATQFNQVSAIRVSLVVRGTMPKSAANGQQTILINGVNQTKNDGFLRKVFSSTFMVRNR